MENAVETTAKVLNEAAMTNIMINPSHWWLIIAIVALVGMVILVWTAFEMVIKAHKERDELQYQLNCASDDLRCAVKNMQDMKESREKQINELQYQLNRASGVSRYVEEIEYLIVRFARWSDRFLGHDLSQYRQHELPKVLKDMNNFRDELNSINDLLPDNVINLKRDEVDETKVPEEEILDVNPQTIEGYPRTANMGEESGNNNTTNEQDSSVSA
jgi:hypothetical protein